MEEIFLIMAVIGVVLFVVLFTKISGLKKEIMEIRELMSHGKKSHVIEDEIKSSQIIQKTSRVSKDIPHYEIENREPSYLSDFIDWLKTDWLMKLGALFVLLAIAWFVRYAIVNNWIGEMGRVALGLIVSAGILVGGFSQIKKRPIPGQVLMAIGTLGILITVYIARNYYDIFTPMTAMGITIFTVVMISIIAVVNESLSLAVTALLGGIASPLLINSHEENYLFLNLYLLILNCGVFAMVALRGWRILLPFALIATFIYSIETFNHGNLTETGTWVFMTLYYLLFFLGTNASVIYKKKISMGDMITTVLIVLIGIYWVSEFVPDEWQSMVLAGTVIVSALTTSIAFKIGGPKSIAYLNGASAIALLGTATAFELDGANLTIALSLEAATVIAIIRYVIFDVKATLAASILLLVPIFLSLESFSQWRDQDLLNKNFFILLIVGFALYFVGVITKSLIGHSEAKEEESSIKIISKIEQYAAGIFSIALIWRALEVVMESESAAHGTALVIYTIIALIFFFIGLKEELKSMKIPGLVLLAAVILRLVIVEVWQMSLTARTITFVVIGVLLIATAFFQKKQNIINK